MYTETFIVHVKADDIYNDIVEDVETRLPKEKNSNWVNEI